MIIEVIECQDCGIKALSFDNTRVTGPNCKLWNTVITFQVKTEEIKRLADERLASDMQSERREREFDLDPRHDGETI